MASISAFQVKNGISARQPRASKPPTDSRETRQPVRILQLILEELYDPPNSPR
jgi:hypothetical protein